MNMSAITVEVCLILGRFRRAVVLNDGKVMKIIEDKDEEISMTIGVIKIY